MREGALCMMMAIGCTPDPAQVEHAATVAAWHSKRVERLRAPDGWLALAGLVWLEPGERRVGSRPTSDVALPPSAPADLGVLRYRAGAPVELECAAGQSVEVRGQSTSRVVLHADDTVAKLGALTLQVIERHGKLALRIRDGASPVRTGFLGIETWPVDPSWRLEARFERYDPPQMTDIPNVLGWIDREPVVGATVFARGGQEVRLDALAEGDQLFFIFADATNGKESYGAGRYLYADRPSGDVVVLDFNRAYNPPCAFTPYATCPLPPKNNRLPLAVRAGEKRYGKP